MIGNPFTDPNWAANLTDTIDRLVGTIRRVATDRAVKASRALVYGVLAAMALATATPLFVILFVRFTQTVLSRITRTDHDTTVWLSYLVCGVMFLAAGFVALRRRYVVKEKS